MEEATQKKFQVPATITRISALSDGGLSIGLHTQELTPAEKTAILEFYNAFGWFLFAENSFKDLPKEEAPDGFKTPSQQLRGVLYRLWEQKGKQGDSEVFYRQKMAYIVEQFKKQLEPRL